MTYNLQKKRKFPTTRYFKLLCTYEKIEKKKNAINNTKNNKKQKAIKYLNIYLYF